MASALVPARRPLLWRCAERGVQPGQVNRTPVAVRNLADDCLQHFERCQNLAPQAPRPPAGAGPASYAAFPSSCPRHPQAHGLGCPTPPVPPRTQPQTLKRRTRRYLAHTANVCLEEVSAGQIVALCAANCSRKSAISPDSIGFLLDRFRFAVAAELQLGALGYKGHPRTKPPVPCTGPADIPPGAAAPARRPPVLRAGRGIRNSEFGADCRSPMMRLERTTRSKPPSTLHYI
jgi:hypothetical protein